MTPVRVAIVNSHPIQYFAPLYAFLNAAPDISVTALYCSDFSLRGAVDPGFRQTVVWDIDLLSGYQSKFLGSRATVRTPGGFWSLVVPELWREVRSGDYDAVWLHGHNYAACWVAMLAAKSKGIPVLMRCETHLGLERSPLKRMLRKPLLRLTYCMCDALLAIGTRNRQFYRAMGVADERIFLVPYAVDNERIARAAELSSSEKAAIKQELNLPSGVPVVLFASRLVDRKHPAQLIRAVSMLQREGAAVCAIVVGSGEAAAEVQRLASELTVRSVVFCGFKNQSELPRLMGVADIFVLPAEDEPWGLVVNEAMSAGLPVIIGEGMGCAPDLVTSGVTGYTCIAGDVTSLASRLRAALDDRAVLRRMAEGARRRIGVWSFHECLAGVRAGMAFLRSDSA